MTACDVAVVGLGAMGSATLHALAKRGRRVIGFERRTPGHALSSSYGESRVFRMAYFEDPAYVPLLRRALDAWRGLEHETGEDLLTTTGILEAGFAGAPLVEGSRRSAELHGLAHERMTASQANDRFPAFALPKDWDCVVQADAGVLRPEKAISAMVAAACGLGAEARFDTAVLRVEPVGDGVRVVLADGEVVTAGAAVISAGPWIGELLPDLGQSLRLTRQPLAWFEPSRPADTGLCVMPIFLLQAPEEVLYGFPNLFGTGVKFGSHDPCGDLSQADTPRAPLSDAEAGSLARAMAKYVPAAAGPLLRSTVCVYTRSPDEHFILGPHPLASRIVVASPCSGHGFKFASLFGDVLADLALDGGSVDAIPLFRPDRYLP